MRQICLGNMNMTLLRSQPPQIHHPLTANQSRMMHNINMYVCMYVCSFEGVRVCGAIVILYGSPGSKHQQNLELLSSLCVRRFYALSQRASLVLGISAIHMTLLLHTSTRRGCAATSTNNRHLKLIYRVDLNLIFSSCLIINTESMFQT